MKKTFFAAALAFVMTIGGFALSAQDAKSFVANMDVSLKNNLTSNAAQLDKNFGYMLRKTVEVQEGEEVKEVFSFQFYSLSDAMKAAAEDGKVSFPLGTFTPGDAIKFGYGSGSDFVDAPVKVASDPGYSYTYNTGTFYTLDFPGEAYDGTIEVDIIGAPLPASSVTLLVALGAAAAMLLYFNRRKQVRISGQA